ncbi:uncharacterized protein LOC116847377 [Odontomachus brunneus]|uniref:uncharacterized protein LOC116847377 n=1 Tax=Odontomachus brunneus TaxID=486640 RepID=UPI0013F1A80D|nr:uncharacterized protein LOC116847377 [Odontomachus brunneus]XP_032678205.1 uncharacterized protein LOC116847377 [Odontomachus brunneus]
MESHECRDKSIALTANEPRGCCQCGRGSANSRSSRCLRKHTSGCPKSRRRSDDEDEREKEEESGEAIETNSCYDKFALAKRLHAENLQHQPLPDKVDDRVFKNMTVAAHKHRACSATCEAKYRKQANILTRRDRFAPALGYKEPKTRMDLAICWETPVDPVYEPRRSTHIDGSEGGSAPAIFALIQHTPVPKNRELLAHSQEEGDHGKCGCAAEKEKPQTNSKSRDRCCCECLCDGMESIAVAEVAELARGRKPARANSVLRITERRCAACVSEEEKKQRDPRLIKSAVGIALGTERKCDDVRRNGLPPAKMTVPRPRTPFARRAFCIDTLTPPFSVVNGCRDADYPEHWRLMSVYQQSYRNPQRRRARHF